MNINSLITLLLVPITFGCNKADAPSSANQGKQDTIIPMQNSVGSKAETEGELAAVDEVMSFLNSVKFELNTDKTEEGSYYSPVTGQNYKDTDHKAESYSYIDFQYDKDRKTLSWKEIHSSTSYSTSYYTEKTFGHLLDYQMNCTMSLENFKASINTEKKVLNGVNVTEITIPQQVEYLWFDREVDLNNNALYPKIAIGWWTDQKLESKQLEKNSRDFVSLTLRTELAERLKPALEDLFKAHGSKVSKY